MSSQPGAQPGVVIQIAAGGFWNAPPKALPTQVYVMAYNNGTVRAFSGVPSAADRWGSRYCYVVNTAEQRLQRRFSLPARDDAYAFTAEVDATWKVGDPQAVVLAGITNAEEVVADRLKDELWQLTRRYAPNDAGGAEAGARSALARIAEFEGGITVVRATARISTDRRITGATVDRDAQAHTDAMAARKIASLKAVLSGDDSLILLHLVNHPEDTRTVLDMIVTAKERSESVRLGLLDRLFANGFIQDSDLDNLRASVLGTPAQTPGRLSLGTAAPDAVPAAPVPVTVTPTTVVPPDRALRHDAEDDDSFTHPASDPDQAGGVKGWRPIGKSERRSQ